MGVLAIPHYLVVGAIAGGAGYAAWETGDTRVGAGMNLVTALVVIAGFSLLFTARYPRGSSTSCWGSTGGSSASLRTRR